MKRIFATALTLGAMMSLCLTVFAMNLDMKPIKKINLAQTETLAYMDMTTVNTEVNNAALEKYLQFQEKDREIEEKYLHTEANIQYFANLNFDEAEDELRPVILAARNRIVSRYSWVADGVSGRILDVEGNIKTELPRFSEVFPEDWEEPMCPVVVDISYYQ